MNTEIFPDLDHLATVYREKTNLNNRGSFILKNKGSGEYASGWIDSKPTPDVSAARRYTGTYLNRTAWDWSLWWDAIEQ